LTHLAALTALFDRARNEDISTEQYQAFAAKLASEAGKDPEKLDRAAAEVEKARAYANYEKLLFGAGRVDFGSQIRLALRLLRERAHVRREVQDQFRWILVDEFRIRTTVRAAAARRRTQEPHPWRRRPEHLPVPRRIENIPTSSTCSRLGRCRSSESPLAQRIPR
jgi:hypothetical protein